MIPVILKSVHNGGVGSAAEKLRLRAILSRVPQAKCEIALTLLERCRTDVKLSVKRKPNKSQQILADDPKPWLGHAETDRPNLKGSSGQLPMTPKHLVEVMLIQKSQKSHPQRHEKHNTVGIF